MFAPDKTGAPAGPPQNSAPTPRQPDDPHFAPESGEPTLEGDSPEEIAEERESEA